MRYLVPTVAAVLCCSPVPAFAQGSDAAVPRELIEKLDDPATQQQLAGMTATMGEVLLDMPLAPLARAAAQMAGKDAEDIPGDMTLRQMAGPDAERLPGEMAERLPQLMGAMAGMAKGLDSMLPLLRVMAAQMQSSIEDASDAPARERR